MLYIRDFFQKHILLVDAVLLIFGFLFLLWKIPYGSYMDDQAYIIESSQRLYLGDALLVDDWFPAQLVGFINLPFFVLWMKIQGSVEGIDLFYRYSYLFLWTVEIIVFYLFMRRRYPKSPYLGIGCLYLYLFTSLDQMTLSYNFWAYGMLLMVIALQLCCRSVKIRDFWTGCFLAIAILGNPYLLLLFILGWLISAVHDDAVHPDKTYSWLRRMFRISLGIVPVFLVFVLFVFSRASLSEVLTNVPYLFQRDGYQQRPFYQYVIQPLIVKYGPLLLEVCLPVMVVSAFDPKKEKRALFYLAIDYSAIAITLIELVRRNMYPGFNYIMLPFAFLAAEFSILLGRMNKEILFIDVIGLVYGAVLLYSSDLGIASMIIGFSLIGFTLFLQLDKLNFPNSKKQTVYLIASAMLIMLQMSGEIYTRYRRSYQDKTIEHLNTVISTGAMKGVITTEKRARDYETILSEARLATSTLNKDDPVLILLSPSQLYLDLSVKVGAYDTYPEETDQRIIEILQQYYQIHPENYPKMAILKKENGKYNPAFLELFKNRTISLKETDNALYVQLK